MQIATLLLTVLNVYNRQKNISIKFAVFEMLTKNFKRYKTETLNSDGNYHTENHQSPQYVDILDVTYVAMGRMI